jgi:hypothetical protein
MREMGAVTGDFQHGTVLLNATTAPHSFVLGPGYRRISGTQDPITNSGAAVTAVTVPARDSLLLDRTS